MYVYTCKYVHRYICLYRYMVLWQMKHLVHRYAQFKCSSCYKAIMVMVGKACFIWSMYLYPYLAIYIYI